jgi:hypothetical protein
MDSIRLLPVSTLKSQRPRFTELRRSASSSSKVTGERIRDKIAASKEKGMWMGGLVPIGYDVVDRRLVVNQTEAETMR